MFALSSETLFLEYTEMSSRKKPVVIEGVDYPSITDASVVLNLHVDTVRRRVNSTLETWMDWRFAKTDVKAAQPARSKREVIIKGIRYESVTAAAKAIGETYNVIYGRILSDSPNYADYRFANLIPCRIRANPDPKKPKTIAVRVGDKTYPTLHLAAKAEGVTVHGLRNRKRQTHTATVEFVNARTGELIC